MFCNKCGAEINENNKFCPKCGAKNFSEDSIESCEKVNENINAHGSNKKLFIIAICLLLVIVIIITITIFHFGSNNVWNDYLQTHQVDENAKNITYYVTDIGGDASDFSYDLSTDRIISSQVYDIDNDGVEELLQITIRKDKDNIQIYPCLEVVKESNGTYATESYDFSNAKYYISTLFEGDYYLYKSEKNTYVLVEKDAPGESWQFYAAGVISCDKNSFASYSFTQYDNGDSECYDNYKDETIISRSYGDSSALEDSYNLSQMSNLRILFSELGLKGFLTGTDDVNNIMNYNDITLIGKFSVTINGSQGHITYTDLICEGE